MTRPSQLPDEPSRSLVLRNRQRDCAINMTALRRIVRYHLDELLELPAYDIAAHLVSATAMAKANQGHLGHHGPTDVITFDYREVCALPADAPQRRTGILPVSKPTRRAQVDFHSVGSKQHVSAELRDRQDASPALAQFLHGELLVCPAVAREQAKEFGTTWPSEVLRYLVHGILHLQGYDDLVPAKRRVMKRRENHLMTALERAHQISHIQK